MFQRKEEPYSPRASMQVESAQYLVPTNGHKLYSQKQSDCRFGCYMNENPSKPEVEIAAKLALKEYIRDQQSRLKDLVLERVVDAKIQLIGFLNHNHRLNFLAKGQTGCEMYSFFCPSPHKCRAEVNIKNNVYSVTNVDCQPRVGQVPNLPGWDW